MADKTMPTPGPWRVYTERGKARGGRRKVLAGNYLAICHTYPCWNNGRPQSLANADLIAAAGTAAHECAEMGCDPVEAVGALPRVLELLNEARVELGSQALGNMDEPDLSDAAGRVAQSIADLMADICSAAGKEGAGHE
jgi:hypothetical protein